ncbi:hypothetical protein [Paraburkholderia kururiensis]|uniref:Metallopeptidase domain-containing protein n=1 Tax=Paraburkholderia kururiensis TaxID=984307 RepID=A0ABZ0WV14_9BURK|nr:hypothetical protein [Paraburkholderia kururiensis]WQD81268.1 hypothetical protein U0042_29795 [Paraburkholderia kururiensis]
MTENQVRELTQRVNMAFYPFEYMAELTGQNCNGMVVHDMLARADVVPTVWMSQRLADTDGFELTYLHEVCHIITARYGLDREGIETVPHNRFFGLLVAICYTRLEKQYRLKLYDFADGAGWANGGRMGYTPGERPSAAELGKRLAFIIGECDRYAVTGLSIEEIAADLAERRRAAARAADALQTRRRRRWNWMAGTLGAVVVLALLASSRALGLI